MSDDFEPADQTGQLARIADTLEALAFTTNADRTSDRLAKSLEVIAPAAARIALALERLIDSLPTQHERIQAECLYALLVNAGIEPSVIVSGQWADKLHEYIEAAKKIALLANRGEQK